MKRTIKAFLASCLAISLLNFTPVHASGKPHPQETDSPINIPTFKTIKPVDPAPAAMATVEPIPVAPDPPVVESPAPAAQTAPTGCVTGYSSGDYYLDKIINFESGPHNGGLGGGNSCIHNYLGCFGLLQACPGAPLEQACGGNPSCQIAWFQANKTGGRSWAQVWQHELDYGWW